MEVHMGAASIGHWVIVLAVILLLAGMGRLKNIGKELGGAVKDFKHEMKKESPPKDKQ